MNDKHLILSSTKVGTLIVVERLSLDIELTDNVIQIRTIQYQTF